MQRSWESARQPKTFPIHIGLNRKTNQDRYLICLDTGMDIPVRPAVLLALADGVDGAVGGEIAADHVIQHLAMPDHPPTPAFLPRFAWKMDRDICAMAEKDPYLNGMGTTLTCAVLWNHTVFWVHSGDSRLYHLRENTLTKITRRAALAGLVLSHDEIRKIKTAKYFYYPAYSLTAYIIFVSLGAEVFLISSITWIIGANTGNFVGFGAIIRIKMIRTVICISHIKNKHRQANIAANVFTEFNAINLKIISNKLMFFFAREPLSSAHY